MKQGKISLLVLLVLSSLIGLNVLASSLREARAQQELVTICHATSSDTNPYEQITAAYPAIYGVAGHFSEPGTPNSGHEEDYEGECTCEDLPANCASPSPKASPSPSASPRTEPSPSPESSPDPAQEVGLGINGPSCTSNSFHTELKVKVGGVGQKDITVKFSYKAEEKTAKTNSDGVAGVDFEFRGNGEVKAMSDGYSTQTVGVESPKDCSAGQTNGQVLGAMAETGNPVVDLMNLVFSFGAGLIGLGVKTYAKKN